MSFTESDLRLIVLNDIPSCKKYLKLMLDYYFDVILKFHKQGFSTIRMAESTIWIQMMFTNALSIAKLLDGIPFRKCLIQLNPIIDHRVVFSMVRNMYESLIAFELIYIIPQSDEMRTILYCLYEVAGYNEQLETLSEEIKSKNPGKISELLDSIDRAISEIKNTSLYQTMSTNSKNIIDNAIRNKKFRYRFDANNELIFIKYEEAYKLLNLSENGNSLFENEYKYFSNMSHPSHWALLQYEQSFDSSKPEFVQLVCTASKYLITIMSVFIEDFKLIHPSVNSVYDGLKERDKYLIKLYNDLLRKNP